MENKNRKTCVHCKESLPLGNFNWEYKDKGIKSDRCKKCQNDATRRHYENNKSKYRDMNRRGRLKQVLLVAEYLKGKCCVDCGESDIVVLQFDHVRGNKVANINQMARRRIKELQEEIDKCEIRCANCHARRHNKEILSIKWQLAHPDDPNIQNLPEHRKVINLKVPATGVAPARP